MVFRHITLITLLFLLPGCIPGELSSIPHRTYPNSYSFYDLTISWAMTTDQGSATISGSLKNNSYYYIREPELTATLLDADDRIIGEGTFLFFPHQMSPDEIAPFSIRIPVKGGQAPSRVRFTYRYRLAEEGWFGSPRFHSFDANP